MKANKNIFIYIAIAVVLLAAAYYFFFKKKKNEPDSSTTPPVDNKSQEAPQIASNINVDMVDIAQMDAYPWHKAGSRPQEIIKKMGNYYMNTQGAKLVDEYKKWCSSNIALRVTYSEWFVLNKLCYEYDKMSQADRNKWK